MQLVECQSTPDIKTDMSTFEEILDSKLATNTLINDIDTIETNGNEETVFEGICEDLNGKIPEIIAEDLADATEYKPNMVPQDGVDNSDLNVKPAEVDHKENDNLSKPEANPDPLKEEPSEELGEEIDRILQEKLRSIQNDNALLTKDTEIETDYAPVIKSEDVKTESEVIESDNSTDNVKIEQNTSDPIHVEKYNDDECKQQLDIKEESGDSNVDINEVTDTVVNTDKEDIPDLTTKEEEKEKIIEVIDVDISEKSPLDEGIIKDDVDDVNDENEVIEVLSSNNTETEPTEPVDKVTPQNTISSDLSMEIEDTIEVEVPELSNSNIIDLDEITDSTISTETASNSESPQVRKEPEKKISRLSNNLDILSDDDEEGTISALSNEPVTEGKDKENSAKDESSKTEDDDDIVLIEDTKDTDEILKNKEDITTDVKDDPVEVIEENTEKKANFMESIELSCNKGAKELETDHPQSDDALNVKKPEMLLKILLETKKEVPEKPLLSTDFLKTSKKSLASMTRDELEEFCILKIVESVVDRINFADTQTNLKTLTQNLKEYEKKTNILAKQNKDLQVVLKSIQEEQKKSFSNSQPITPLKITRSVGMQVLMPDKPILSRKKLPQVPNVVPPLSVIRTRNQSQGVARATTQAKPAQNNENIPVPRLIPANNATKIIPKSPSPSCSTKTTVTPVNGVRNTPQKAEKRPLNKDQPTVDLTDDEPPNKIVTRNPQPPVRLVSPQNLMAPQRPSFGQGSNTLRKVFIPINSSNGQIRAGQTVMIKPHPSAMIRQRPSTPNMRSVKNTRHRHPAPLPDNMKQYHPLNWKALPPAPDLKLSKVENGIVISWKINGYQEDNHEEIASYQLYAYQETSAPPSTALWKKIGDVKALPLPMACTLTQFTAGNSYYFAVRAVDVKSRLGPFSEPGSILLPQKM